MTIGVGDLVVNLLDCYRGFNLSNEDLLLKSFKYIETAFQHFIDGQYDWFLLKMIVLKSAIKFKIV